MDTRQLKYFLTLAESLNFGRAGKMVHLSTSALSRAIRQLEDEVGTALFLRDNRSVSLTPAGTLFHAYARDVLQQWEMMRLSLLERSAELRGELSLFCSVTASYSFLYDILSDFRRDHPGIEIKLRTGDPEHAIGRVLAGDEDLAIAARPDTLPRDLDFRPLTVSPLVFIAPNNEPQLVALLHIPIAPATWENIPMILPESGVSRQRVDRWFGDLGVKARIYAQVAGNEAIVSMVGLGFGVGVVPRIVLDASPLADRVCILSVTPALPPYEVGLVARRRSLRSPLIRALWTQSSVRPPSGHSA
ncbi:MAG: transcriptional regulator IlvY [Desulfobulbaceae bacterium A2]|nr:MAG: transcriptional regulator IlvY [Desulfobulbaceae bacterium A2]